MFTSKLPRFANSAKRPSGPNDGSTSFLASNIPVSVRKANLFTPQPKRSLTLSGTATKPYMTTEKKYPRVSKPMPDRDEQMRMFTTLADYLKANAPGFPIPDPKKFLLSVSTTETARIFEILISRLYPNFKINKLEVDVPEILALLEYPYIRTVTKSALVSVTTRQAVGNLLVIFNWLVTQINSMTEASAEWANDDEELMDMLKGEQDDTMDDDLQAELMKKEEEMYKIHVEITELRRRADELDEYKEAIRAYDEDIQKCKDYCAQMEKYLEVKKVGASQLEQELTKRRQDLEDKQNYFNMLVQNPTFPPDPAFDPASGNLERLEDELKSKVLENDSIQRDIDSIMVQEKVEHERLSQELKQFMERADKEEAVLMQKINAERDKLKVAEEENKRHEDLLLELFKNTLEANKQEAQTLVETVKRDNEYWTKVEKRVIENNKVARRGMKLLCTRQFNK